MNKSEFSRRNFITKTTIGSHWCCRYFGVPVPQINQRKKTLPPELLDQAPDGKVLKAGLIGCGGRGTGAAINFLDAGPNLQITALGDVFQDKIDNCREN